MQCSFNRFCFFTASACRTAVIHAVALPCADAHAQSAAFLAERGGERVALAAYEGDGLRDVVVGSVDGDGYEVVARGGLRAVRSALTVEVARSTVAEVARLFIFTDTSASASELSLYPAPAFSTIST